MNLKQNVNSEASYDTFNREFWERLPRIDGKLDEEWMKQEMWDYFCTMHNLSYIYGSITDGEIKDSRTEPEKVIDKLVSDMNEQINDVAKNYLYTMIEELDNK